MKYLPLQSLEDFSEALNFDTPDLRVVGSCDVYTTKAAGGDKKLYKNIEHSLESQYESLLRYSASLSPPQATHAAAALNLSRSSPFGPLSQISSRRIFAYLIATLNASHPDYDISTQLRPSDFRREKSLRLVMNTLDSTLQNLRPKSTPRTPNPQPQWSEAAVSTVLPSPGVVWNPKMWRAIDKQMHLRECSIYSYAPEDDPYDDEDEPTLWSFNYFFFNKTLKRVCYIYLRGISILSQSTVPRTPLSARAVQDDSDLSGGETGASKRAQYWLGDRFLDRQVRRALGADEDDDHLESTSPEVTMDNVSNNADTPRLLPIDAPRLTLSDVGSPESDASSAMMHGEAPPNPEDRGGSEEIVGKLEV